MLGTAKPVVTTQDLQFSTSGTVTLSGTSVTPSSGVVRNIQRVPLNGLNMNLGVWNLATTPIYEAQPAEIKALTWSQGAGYYLLNFIPRITFVKNPAINLNVTAAVTCVEYNRYNGELGSVSIAPHPGVNGQVTYTGAQLHPTTLYADSLTTILSHQNTYQVFVPLLPNRTTSANMPALDFSSTTYNIKQPVVFKIKVVTNGCKDANGNTFNTYSTKTFIPNHTFYTSGIRPYSWTLKELENRNLPYQ